MKKPQYNLRGTLQQRSTKVAPALPAAVTDNIDDSPFTFAPDKLREAFENFPQELRDVCSLPSPSLQFLMYLYLPLYLKFVYTEL